MVKFAQVYAQMVYRVIGIYNITKTYSNFSSENVFMAKGESNQFFSKCL